MNGLQEKFQVIAPAKQEADEGWASASSARTTGGAGFLHQSNGSKFNQLPPGMEIEQARARIRGMPFSVAGETDVSADTNPGAFTKGYTRREMNGADDLYTGEHVDHFYGEAVDENGNCGFAERNNYMDRE